MAIKTRFSEDSPIKFTLKGIPEINTDLWKISSVSCSNSNILSNIADDGKSFELISPSKAEKSTCVYLNIDFVGMPIEKEMITKYFEWEGEYVESIKPIYHIEGITEASNGSATYRLVIDNVAEYTYPIICEWSITKVHGFETASESIGVSNDTIFNVTYTNLSQEDAIASTVFEVTAVIKSKHNPLKIVDTFTFRIHTSYEDPVITKESNSIIMNYCYAAGFCSDPNKMYKDECEAVTSINSNTFTGNGVPASFEEFRYFTGLTKIPNSAFHYNSSTFKRIILPDTITSIGDSVFQGCFGIESMVIPVGVTRIEPSTFSFCRSMKSIEIKGKVRYIGGSAFYNCFWLQDIIADFSDLTVVGPGAFYYCFALKELDLSNSHITSLPDNFIDSSTPNGSANSRTEYISSTIISLPEGLTSIGSMALSNPYIKELYIYEATAPSVKSDSFANIGKNVSDKNLYIPSGSTGYESWEDAFSEWSINKYL